ncbi:Hypothetical predicted protein, partial [Mytilus galloprovincialis]
NPQCLWSAWSFLTLCSPSTIFGKQYRFRKYYGPEHSCHKNETIEDKDCADDQYKFDLTLINRHFTGIVTFHLTTK